MENLFVATVIQNAQYHCIQRVIKFHKYKNAISLITITVNRIYVKLIYQIFQISSSNYTKTS